MDSSVPHMDHSKVEMVQLLRESLRSIHHQIPIENHSSAASGKRCARPASGVTSHVTLDGFGESGITDILLRQGRRRSRSRSLIKEHRTGAGITNVIICADECVYQLQQVATRLSSIASRNDQLAKGQKVSDPGQDFAQLAELSQRIMTISREAFVPAHRLCQSCVGLYLTEDFIRESSDITSCLDHFSEGRIKVPSQDSQTKTMDRLQVCLDIADSSCVKFYPLPASTTDRHGVIINPKINQEIEYEEMRDVLLIMQSALKNLYSTASGCFHLFGLLLYIDPEQQETLAEFLNSLNSMEKSDLLEDISTLRRSVDHIPLLLEKLSWASYAVFRLANGKSISPSPVDSGVDTRSDITSSQPKTHLNSILTQKILAQKEFKTEEMYSRATNSRRSREKQLVQQAPASECDFRGRHASKSRSRSNKSGKAQSKSKSRIREGLNDRQQDRGGSVKSIDKKAGQNQKSSRPQSQYSKKSKRFGEVGSQEDVEYYE